MSKIRLRNKDGEVHEYVLRAGLINTKHPDGSPALVTFLQEDAKIELSGGEEFVLFFVKEDMSGIPQPELDNLMSKLYGT